jgi:hypothetical protein
MRRDDYLEVCKRSMQADPYRLLNFATQQSLWAASMNPTSCFRVLLGSARSMTLGEQQVFVSECLCVS